MRIAKLIALCAIASGCLGDPGAPPTTDGGSTILADLSIACTSNNDGVIERSELPIVIGASASYLQNPDGTAVTVDPDGESGPQGIAWDLTSTQGVALSLPIIAVTGTWFESSFPDATYATYTDPTAKVYGVFKLTDTALQLMGYASETPNDTLLVYDVPLDTLRFPVQVGQGWTQTGHIVNGTYNQLPVAETDTYKVSVDEKGIVVLPYLDISNSLRIHVDLDQADPGGTTTHTIQYLFFRECDGELGRMVSQPNETNENFTSAATFRRLALQ